MPGISIGRSVIPGQRTATSSRTGPSKRGAPRTAALASPVISVRLRSYSLWPGRTSPGSAMPAIPSMSTDISTRMPFSSGRTDTLWQASHPGAQGVAVGEVAQDGVRVDDLAAPDRRLELLGLVRLEVTGMLVHVDPGAQAVHVEFGVKLRRVNVGADPERLHRAARGAGQQDGLARQRADRLLVTGERVERPGHVAHQRILPAVGGERDRHTADRFGVPPVDGGPLLAAERPDAVAGAEEREVGGDHPIEQP